MNSPPQIRIPVAKPLCPSAEAIIPYLKQIDESRWYSNFGPLCLELQRRLAGQFGLHETQLVTLTNATQGLMLALHGADAKAGTYCLVPSWTFSASVHAVLGAGLIPYFVDVDEEQGLLTPAIARRALAEINEPVGAVMPVAVYGQPINASDWDSFGDETGLAVVVDAAPGYDSVRPGRVLTAVSLHATKLLGMGEGAFVMSTDEERVLQVKQRANFGFMGSRDAQLIGTNAKISEYAAAVGLAALDQHAQARGEFQNVANIYREQLARLSGVGLLPGFGDSWLAATCIVRTTRPMRHITDALAGEGIETRAWWGHGMHLASAFRHFPRLALPATRRLAETTIGLPFYRGMTDANVNFVCERIAEALVAKAI